MKDRELSRPAWRKSSHSGSTGGDCVEIARVDGARAVRDSKNPGGGFLSVASSAWTALLAEIKQGTYDL